MDEREYLRAYLSTLGSVPQAAEKLGIPYPTLAGVLSGYKGVGRNLAERLQLASNNFLDANRLVWIRPTRKQKRK
jgi:hypothetical protein